MKQFDLPNLKLLNLEELAWSAVVANNAMNRERVAVGINSYEKDLGFNPLEFLRNRQHQKKVRWLDLCCGRGNALIQAAEIFYEEKQTNIALEGIDLVDFFSPYHPRENFKLYVQNLEKWTPQRAYDLITIVHGLHYLGDKLKLIKKSMRALKADGKFIANLDLQNIKITNLKNPQAYIYTQFANQEVAYSIERKLVNCNGKKNIDFNLAYLGADDKAGANYTGQPVVNSFYQLEF